MEYLPEIAQLCVTAVNIVFILVFCFIDTGTSKHPKKKNMIAGISLLAVDFVSGIFPGQWKGRKWSDFCTIFSAHMVFCL